MCAPTTDLSTAYSFTGTTGYYYFFLCFGFSPHEDDIFFILKASCLRKRASFYIIWSDLEKEPVRLEKERWRFNLFMEVNVNVHEIIPILSKERCAYKD